MDFQMFGENVFFVIFFGYLEAAVKVGEFRKEGEIQQIDADRRG
ncbi:hypothetical protein L21SP2_3166 [Salinispira pacifica]|uniref:Uncharacterized protein n=1 Tax=Salinispira pacifica TaxID=1307761 RepID=V5WNE8_9SPIO|nr:hypothetical protein L21SP2_3166 [Salinispira pacifica]